MLHLQIVEAGALPIFVRMMQYTDVDEQCSAARALWSMSFDQEVKQKIVEEPQCVETLEKLANSEAAHVRKAAKGALWKLEDKAEKSHEAAGQNWYNIAAYMYNMLCVIYV